MCGLTGVAGNYINKDHWNAFEQLLYASAVRGWDATGVAGVYKEKGAVGWELHKQASSSLGLLLNKEVNTLFNRRFDLKVLIGHCRAATVGSNVDANAHPFEFEHLVGAHNGTLSRRSPNQKLYDTDSEALFADINERGVEKAIPDVSGAWALTWFDKFQGTLNFLRNDQRDLYIAVLKHTDTIFWASESGLLEWVLRRQNFDIDSMVKLKPDLHVRFKIFEPKWLETMETTEVKGAPPVTYFRPGPALPFVVGAESKPPLITSSETKKDNVVPIEKESSVVKKEPRPSARVKWRKGWKGELFDDPSYQVMLDSGCCYCGTIEEARCPHRWIDRDSYLCNECKDSWFAGSATVCN